MKKIRTIKYLMVLILLLVFINSIFYIEYNNLTKVKLTENDVGKIKLNVVHSPIIINGNGDFSPSNGVTSGDGSYGNPYIIEDYTIDVDGPLNCIFINNTNVYFKIQNCILINSGTTPADTTIELNNVTNGLIFDNDISLAAIRLSYSHNNNISDNQILNCKEIYFFFSDNNELGNNYIQNSTNGIRLVKSNNNTIIANEIYDCGDYGIKIHWASNNTRIIENYIYNNGGYTGIAQIDIDFDCIGTIIEGNYFRYRIIPPEFPWLYIILAVAIGAVVIISVVLYRRYRRTKELKHPEPPEFPEPDEPPAATEQVDLPEPPELDED